jgi:methyl-accepting chemotaxis protein
MFGTSRRSAREAGVADTDQGGYHEAVEAITAACERVASGDLEVRVPSVDGPPEVQRLRIAVNHIVDVTDAYVRESGASLRAASEGRFYRQFLVRGMPGAFRSGARLINTAREGMKTAAAQADADDVARQDLAERVYDISTQVAAAATELSASAGSLSESTRSAVTEANAASSTVHELERTSQEIQHAVTLIKQVADQTRLLSLNATIEAARAGEAGRGFAVVAAEVKGLADEAASSSDDITVQVERAQSAAADAVAAIARITDLVRDMDAQVAGVAVAAGSSTGHGADGGLSHMAESLRAEIAHFASSR